eukprot:3128481-Rhodomonas_salina.2
MLEVEVVLQAVAQLRRQILRVHERRQVRHLLLVLLLRRVLLHQEVEQRAQNERAHVDLRTSLPGSAPPPLKVAPNCPCSMRPATHCRLPFLAALFNASKSRGYLPPFPRFSSVQSDANPNPTAQPPQGPHRLSDTQLDRNILFNALASPSLSLPLLDYSLSTP